MPNELIQKPDGINYVIDTDNIAKETHHSAELDQERIDLIWPNDPGSVRYTVTGTSIMIGQFVIREGLQIWLQPSSTSMFAAGVLV